MEWLESLNRAVGYIEEHLDGEIDVKRAAQIARCSPFHFQRMFSYMADVTLTEYIRRRRMTRAAFDLQHGREKIVDIALKYGYESPTAFNRAFHGVHGVAPSQARQQGAALKTYPPIRFQLSIIGGAEMNYHMEHKAAFTVVGRKTHIAGSIDEGFAKVPQAWQKAYEDGLVPRLVPLMDLRTPGVLGLSTPGTKDGFDYYIGVVSGQAAPPELDAYQVAEGDWAVFECVGALPAAIQTLQKRIVTEWLPNSGYEYADAPDIEVYFEGDQSAPDYRCEVWLPVRKK